MLLFGDSPKPAFIDSDETLKSIKSLADMGVEVGAITADVLQYITDVLSAPFKVTVTVEHAHGFMHIISLIMSA